MRRVLRVAALAAVLSIAAAACGDSGDSNGATASSSTTTLAQASSTAAAPTTVTPVKGGTLTIGTYSEAPGLDPITTSGAGTTYGMEMASIYDRLIQYDPVSKQYKARLAESFTANADSSEWTLKVRQNIKFADGTAYDAEAVKFNIDRHKASNAVLRGPLTSISAVTVVDPLTVKVTLTGPWPGFVALLGSTLGMIVSPAAIKAGARHSPPTR